MRTTITITDEHPVTADTDQDDSGLRHDTGPGAGPLGALDAGAGAGGVATTAPAIPADATDGGGAPDWVRALRGDAGSDGRGPGPSPTHDGALDAGAPSS